MSSLVSIAYDANQHFFAGLNSMQRGKSFGHRSIQAGCAFERVFRGRSEAAKPLLSLMPSQVS